MIEKTVFPTRDFAETMLSSQHCTATHGGHVVSMSTRSKWKRVQARERNKKGSSGFSQMVIGQGFSI